MAFIVDGGHSKSIKSENTGILQHFLISCSICLFFSSLKSQHDAKKRNTAALNFVWSNLFCANSIRSAQNTWICSLRISAICLQLNYFSSFKWTLVYKQVTIYTLFTVPYIFTILQSVTVSLSLSLLSFIILIQHASISIKKKFFGILHFQKSHFQPCLILYHSAREKDKITEWKKVQNQSSESDRFCDRNAPFLDVVILQMLFQSLLTVSWELVSCWRAQMNQDLCNSPLYALSHSGSDLLTTELLVLESLKDDRFFLLDLSQWFSMKNCVRGMQVLKWTICQCWKHFMKIEKKYSFINKNCFVRVVILVLHIAKCFSPKSNYTIQWKQWMYCINH